MSRWLATLLLTTSLIASAHARLDRASWAALEPGSPPRAAPMQANGLVSLSQAVEMATSRYPGRVVRAETVTRGGRSEHHIRILGDDGRVRTVRIDAQSGAFL